MAKIGPTTSNKSYSRGFIEDLMRGQRAGLQWSEIGLDGWTASTGNGGSTSRAWRHARARAGSTADGFAIVRLGTTSDGPSDGWQLPGIPQSNHQMAQDNGVDYQWQIMMMSYVFTPVAGTASGISRIWFGERFNQTTINSVDQGIAIQLENFDLYYVAGGGTAGQDPADDVWKSSRIATLTAGQTYRVVWINTDPRKANRTRILPWTEFYLDQGSGLTYSADNRNQLPVVRLSGEVDGRLPAAPDGSYNTGGHPFVTVTNGGDEANQEIVLHQCMWGFTQWYVDSLDRRLPFPV